MAKPKRYELTVCNGAEPVTCCPVSPRIPVAPGRATSISSRCARVLRARIGTICLSLTVKGRPSTLT